MYYIIDENNKNANELLQENISLKKEINVLTVANGQLKEECERYKSAYERYSSLFIIKIAKKILGKQI